MKIRDLLRKRPRFAPYTDYECSGCHWWFEHIKGDAWRGAYFADPTTVSGQYPPAGTARTMTYEDIGKEYGDCVNHLVPRRMNTFVKVLQGR